MTAGPQAEPWTTLRLLQWTTEFFQRKGYDSPRLDAEVLLATALGCRRIELYTAFDKEPPEEVRVAFRELVRRRGEGTPVAYLVGHKEFYSLNLTVNESVLIPRPETEHAVIEVLDYAKKRGLAKEPLRIADVGTGSGAIAIAIAKHLPKALLMAVDVSATALAVAQRNVTQHQLSERIELVEADLFSGKAGPIAEPSSFDVIVSNPPYVSEPEYEQLSNEVRGFEPRLALVSGPTGTEMIERLLQLAPEMLKSDGGLIIELSPMIAEKAKALAEQQPTLTQVRLVRDLAGHYRLLCALKR